jgi:thiol:disulfide interchange protein DsbC
MSLTTFRSTFVSVVLCLVAAHGHAASDDFSARLLQRFPSMAGAQVAPAFRGFYSVVRGREVLFVRDDFSVLVSGDVIDLRNNQSMASALRAANRPKIHPADLDVSDAIKFGTGSRKLYLFSDPDCPYCKQLENELPKVKDVQVFLFPFPITGLHPNARSVAESIWCQADRAGAWRSYVTTGAAPATVTCDNPISRNLLLGEKLQIQGTPALIFEDGSVVPGAISADRIEAQLAAAARK